MAPVSTLGFVGAAVIAYLVGSVPFGLLLTRLAGLGDVRRLGSGNIGATNVLRTGRRDLAAATLLLDGLKGAVAVLGCTALFGAGAVAAVAAVIGHCAPVWLGFRGGKGVATALGVALALDWRVGLACCLAWLLVAGLSRISSAGALAAIVLAPVLAAMLQPWPVPAGLGVIALIVVLRHRANIGRLLAGTEPRIGRS